MLEVKKEDVVLKKTTSKKKFRQLMNAN